MNDEEKSPHIVCKCGKIELIHSFLVWYNIRDFFEDDALEGKRA